MTDTLIPFRPNQQTAWSVIIDNRRGIIKMFCGTGKTRIFFYLVIHVAARISLIVFPRIALLEQFKRDYMERQEWLPLIARLSAFYICSKTESRHAAFTTDAAKIEDFLLSNTPAKLICVTYQSLGTVVDALQACDLEVDLAIYDEAHNCTAPKTYDHVTSICADRAYYFTATPTQEMEEDKDEVFGDTLFSYTHREAVEDDVCNDFEIICRFALPDECNLYEHMAAAYTRSPNGRMLVFHSFAEAEVEGRTSVVQFSGAKAQRECAAAFRKIGKTPTLQSVIAKTKDKQAILDAFEATPDDAISILHNCNILGEGIDTKAANAIVFADPKASHREIIQNIGRVARKPAGVVRPASIIIPVVVDIAKFNAAATPEERHSLICDEFKKGNFQAIQNVLSALRQKDEELMDAILRSPTRYTKAEVERTFTRAGYGAVAEAATLGELFGLEADTTVEAAAAAIGRSIEVHSGDMEEPVRTVGSGSAALKVMHAEDTWTKMERPDDVDVKVKAPQRPVKVRYDFSDKLGIKWDIVSAIKEIGAATIDCTLGIDNWEERRQEYIAFMKRSEGKYKPDLKSTDAVEKSLAIWMKNQIQDKRHSRIKPERQALLSDTPYWSWDLIDKWVEQHEHWCGCQRKYNRQLSQVASEEDERKAAKWQSMQRLDYKRKQDDPEKAPWLTDERIKALNETNGWTWGGFDEIWDRAFDNWEQVCSELDRRVNSKDLSESQKLAHSWQNKQRAEQTTMSEYRRSKLDAAEYWCWDEKEEAWCDTFQQVRVLGSKLNRVPTLSDDETLGRWCSKQREQYANKVIPVNRTKLLGSLTFWYWKDDNDAKWDVKFEAWKAFYELTGRDPDKRSSAPEERKAGQWQAQQRTKEKDLPQVRFDKLNTTLGWKWSEKRDALSVSSAENTIAPPPKIRVRRQPPAELVEPVEPKPLRVRLQQPPLFPAELAESKPLRVRLRKFKLPNPEAEPSGREQVISEIGTYHKRFHNLNSATYFAEICADPEIFAAYHEVADRLDAKDAPEQQVMTRLAAEAAKLPPKCRIADLGCGMNRLRTLAPHCNWTSVDAVAADDTVQVADLAALPFDDCHFQAAVLSRALWGRDHMKQMQEAFRILNYGAPLIVCESKRRWTGSELLDDLKSAGFHIKVEPADNDEIFQYIVAQKPALL